MNDHDQVFTATLAGLLHNINHLALQAQDKRPLTDILADIVPEQWLADIQETVTNYRQPQSHLQRAVALAVSLAAGGEQTQDTTAPKQLPSIFCGLTLTDKDDKPIPLPPLRYNPLKTLAISAEEESIFPTDALSDAEIEAAYHTLWHGEGKKDGFKKEAQALKNVHHQNKADHAQAVYLNSLLKLLERYTWAVPSPLGTAENPLSLYHHSRITAALAACLVDYSTEQLKAFPQKETDNDIVYLIGGDISGIQDFIYTITARGASSALRGRSLYLQLLTTVVARYVLDNLTLPLSNIIYAGGGHFYLLAPATKKTLDTLQTIRATISRILLTHHQGDLYLAVAHQPLKLTDFQGQSLAERWDGVSEALQHYKQRRFSELDSQLESLLFAPWEQGGNEDKQCAVCHHEHPEAERVKENEDDEDENGVIKCPPCQGFEALGKDLRQANYLSIIKTDIEPVPEERGDPAKWEAILAHFGYAIKISSTPPALNNTTYCEVLALNDNAISKLRHAPQQAVGRHFLVNVTPTLSFDEYDFYKDKVKDLPPVRKGETEPVKPFDIMARQADGLKRLGVLRMDVDGLGQIIKTGLGKHTNLSRIATLSFSLSLFFEGWIEQIAEQINQLAQTNNPQKSNALIYSIYSGGDDLFFVGAWHLMPLLADTIQTDLNRYAAHHPGIHLSGGITLIGGKYPLYQAAADAAKAETAAKDYNEGEKNAFTFLNQTFSWEQYPDIKAEQEKLKHLVDPQNGDKKVPKSLLSRLMQLYGDYAEANRKHQEQTLNRTGDTQVYWGPWHWRGAYSLTRLANQLKNQKQPDSAKAIKEIRNDLSKNNFRNIEIFGLAARWTELLIRRESGEQ